MLLTTKKIKIFADNCFSQNNNKYIAVYLQFMVHRNLDQIQVFYPFQAIADYPTTTILLALKREDEERIELQSRVYGLV